MAPEKKKQPKKEMQITLVSKPLKNESGKKDQSTTTDQKPHDKKRRGTRGPSWIG